MVASPQVGSSVHDAAATEESTTVAYGVTAAHSRRVAVICGSYCVDITLPAHEPVTTLLGGIAEIFFEQIRSSPAPIEGSLIDELCGPGPHGVWELARLGGDVLHRSRSLAQSGVVDGESLILAAPPVPTPAPVWDDSLSALSAQASSGVWTTNDSRRAAALMVAALGVVLGAVLAVGFFRGPNDATTAVAVVAAVSALAFTVIFRSHGAGVATAIVGIASASGFVFLAAAALVPGTPAAIHVVSGASASLLLGTLGAVTASFTGNGDRNDDDPYDRPAAGFYVLERDVFICTSTLSALALVGAMLIHWMGLTPGQVGVGIGVAGWACCLFAPSLTVTFCSLPLPGATVESKSAPDPLEMAEVQEFSARASRLLLALVSTSSTCVVAGSAIAVLDPNSSAWSLALSLCLAVWLMLRVRTVPSRACGIVCMTAGALVLLTTALIAFRNADSLVWMTVFGVLCLAVSAVMAAAGWWVPEKDFSPVARRAVDIFDVLVTCSIIPLALSAAGVIQAVRG